MKKLIAIACTLLITATAFAFSTSNWVNIGTFMIQTEEKNPWNHLKLNNREENFQFAIVSDRTGGHRPGVFSKAIGKLNLMQPEFVMSVGDLIEGGTKDKQRIESEWKEFNGLIDQLEVPFFYVVGNHDVTNEAMVPEWKDRFGRMYYSFTYHDVLFVVLNSEDPPNYSVVENKRLYRPGILGEQQLAWLENVLQANQEARWTIIFVHKPMWQDGERTNWKAVEELLGDRPRTVFAGHHHRYVKTKVGNHNYYALATTGGGSRLAGPEVGQFDHIVWVTMTAEGPRLANLMLDGIWTDDPVAESKAIKTEKKQ